MNQTMNHLWAHMHTEKTDHENAESVSYNPERYNDRNERQAPPRCLQKKISRENASNK